MVFCSERSDKYKSTLNSFFKCLQEEAIIQSREVQITLDFIVIEHIFIIKIVSAQWQLRNKHFNYMLLSFMHFL